MFYIRGTLPVPVVLLLIIPLGHVNPTLVKDLNVFVNFISLFFTPSSLPPSPFPTVRPIPEVSIISQIMDVDV